MKYLISLLFFFALQCAFAQHYDTVYFETENVDENNEIYKLGNVYIYDYEIIDKGIPTKLLNNKGMFKGRTFEFIPATADTIKIEQIHLLVKPLESSGRTNENQTEITYLEGPTFTGSSSTGAAENEKNVWIHPIRYGFFGALETAPFPYIKKPYEIGATWEDGLLIGQGWGDEKWGVWEGQLQLNYTYAVTGEETLTTPIGAIECYVIESTATSTIGVTRLKSYFSPKYGFVRLEYVLLNDLKVNMWLVDFKSDASFNDLRTFWQTKEYIKQ